MPVFFRVAIAWKQRSITLSTEASSLLGERNFDAEHHLVFAEPVAGHTDVFCELFFLEDVEQACFTFIAQDVGDEFGDLLFLIDRKVFRQLPAKGQHPQVFDRFQREKMPFLLG